MAGATKLDQIYQQLQEQHQQMQEQHQQVLTSLKPQRASKPQSISNVGSAEADSILLELQFSQDDGNLASPIVVPAGEPSCSPFDYSQHPSEDAGTPALLKHHEHHLGLFGVQFGRSGFQMYDVHSRRNDLKLIAPSSGRQYNGGVDGIVAPYALMKAGAFTEMRIVYEHKQSIAQKQLYREANLSQFKVRCIQLSNNLPPPSVTGGRICIWWVNLKGANA